MIKSGDMVQIVSDGDWRNTKVLDQNGVMIPMVKSASWECTVGNVPTASLTMHCHKINARGVITQLNQDNPYQIIATVPVFIYKSFWESIFGVRPKTTIQEIMDRKHAFEKAKGAV